MKNEILTGEIISVTPDGNWTDFNKYKVSIKNENQEVGEFNFLARSEFKKQVGETIEYEIKNPTYNSAKLHYKPFNTNTI
tara:strand:- start:3924 stop:4163 length:240 start_codon:yes stop_codon:yes gene_type:complete